MPKRIQRKRTKGWRMPENTIYVGRPTKWGNWFSWGTSHRSDQYVDAYRRSILFDIEKDPDKYNLKELRGKNLACWCPPDQPCHADILLELANKDD